ncbi:uncharacterized protein LOC108674348 [Hyalella azteca]|uniref:Uncharacterized protein LOC108674348 n=1 Tax=Hyalella azteca TaxID=294128 RepID=A0A979FXA6_HYAAZ|nr:uncharacterized protein LOC108674348 [Hyalella azteca]
MILEAPHWAKNVYDCSAWKRVATATLLQDELVPFGAHHYCILAFAEDSILLQASSCKLTLLANFELNFLLALLDDLFECRSLTENLDTRLSTSVSQCWRRYPGYARLCNTARTRHSSASQSESKFIRDSQDMLMSGKLVTSIESRF